MRYIPLPSSDLGISLVDDKRTDNSFGFRIRGHKFPHTAMVQSYSRSGYAVVGVCQLGSRAISIPDIRCGRRHPSVSSDDYVDLRSGMLIGAIDEEHTRVAHWGSSLIMVRILYVASLRIGLTQ
jgi:hypothetical protein